MNLYYKVKEEDIRLTYKQILREKFKISDRMLTLLKKENKIIINPPIFSINQKVSMNTEIIIDLIDRKANILPVYSPFNIVFEDEFFLAVNKESGIATHPSKGHYTDSLANYVEYYLNKNGLSCHLVNRLDKDTSGVVLIAKHSYIHSLVSELMISKNIEKKYFAIVHGKMQNKEGIINLPISISGEKVKREINENGYSALTQYKVIKEYENYSFILLIPHTGRTHQLRVHLSYIGNPILGDKIYGFDDGFEKLFLHSFNVNFYFWFNNTNYNIKAKLPNYFIRLLKIL